MAGQKPRPAMVEDFDESLSETVPDSQQVANTGAKVSSSRTAATVNSTQSGPSGGRSPPAPHKTDLPKRSSEVVRKSSRRDRKDKDRAARPHDENMQMGAYPGSGSARHRSHVGRSPSKSRRRDSYLPHNPDAYYEGSSPYHPSTPVDPRTMDYPPASHYRPPLPDFPPQPGGYPPATEEYHSSRSGRPHSSSYRSSTMYHQDPRGPQWAVGMPRGYQQQMPYYPGYETHHGPPTSGVWQGQGSYPSSPYGPPSHFGQEYYPQEPMYNYPPHPRERSESRHGDSSRRRRSSLYGPPPPADPDVFDYEDDAPENYYDRPRDPRDYREKPRGRASIQPSPEYDDDDRRRMPPPPPPLPVVSQHRAPKVHQQKRPEPPRKIQSAAAVPSSNRRSSRAMDKGFDMSEMMNSMNEIDYDNRRAPRELPAPERSSSLRGSRRSTSYAGNGRSGASVAVANSLRRRRPETYYPEDPGSLHSDMEELERQAERYQALAAGRPATAQLPASHETLLSKLANGAGSDSGSRKSGSNSSRGSATKTEKEAQNMTLSLNGMSIAFGEESLVGKSISIRTGDQGATHLNITDGSTPKRPRPYVQGSSYSDQTSSGGRRVLEDGRRTREDRRSEKSVHHGRSNRSSYSHSQRYRV